MDDEQAREALRRYGYNPDDPVRGRDVPDKLLRAVQDAPLVPADSINRLSSMRAAWLLALRRAGWTVEVRPKRIGRDD